jgi:hypothetical protein
MTWRCASDNGRRSCSSRIRSQRAETYSSFSSGRRSSNPGGGTGKDWATTEKCNVRKTTKQADHCDLRRLLHRPQRKRGASDWLRTFYRRGFSTNLGRSRYTDFVAPSARGNAIESAQRFCVNPRRPPPQPSSWRGAPEEGAAMSRYDRRGRCRTSTWCSRCRRSCDRCASTWVE